MESGRMGAPQRNGNNKEMKTANDNILIIIMIQYYVKLNIIIDFESFSE